MQLQGLDDFLYKRIKGGTLRMKEGGIYGSIFPTAIYCVPKCPIYSFFGCMVCLGVMEAGFFDSAFWMVGDE